MLKAELDMLRDPPEVDLQAVVIEQRGDRDVAALLIHEKLTTVATPLTYSGGFLSSGRL